MVWNRGVLEDFDLHGHGACEGGRREGDHVAVWRCGCGCVYGNK